MNSGKAEIHPVLCVKNAYYWTDSEIRFYRIKGVNKEWKLGVERRVNSVRDGSVVSDWNFVPSALDLTDIVTREFNFAEIQNSDFFWQGHEFFFFFLLTKQVRQVRKISLMRMTLLILRYEV